MFFDEKAYPCSLCIRGVERSDKWQPKERMKGKWLELDRCSCCGKQAYDFVWGPIDEADAPNFCPNCGADMRQSKERSEYELAVEQFQHDALYEPTFNPEDGSM